MRLPVCLLAPVLLVLFTAGCGEKPESTSAGSAPAEQETVTAEREKASPETDKTATNGDGPALWHFSDADTEIYLFGTVHFLKPDTDWRTAQFDEAFAASDILYLEVDVDMAAQLAAVDIQKKLGTLPEGERLESFFTEDEYRLLSAKAKELRLPMTMFQPLRPWLVFATISTYDIMAHGGDPNAGVESVLTTDAIAAGMERRAFADWDTHTRILADLPDQAMADLLIESVRQTREEPDYFDEILASWLSGDAEAIGDMLTQDMDQLENADMFLDRIIYDRNADWAVELDRVMREETGTIFVAVGAGHLAGNKSVQALLETRGYKISRL